MNKIKRKSRIFYIIFGTVDIILLLAAAFLLAATLLFSGGSAPSVFGYNVFLVETDAFSLIRKGSALIVEQTEYNEINPGNIIIFNDDDEIPRVGEVLAAEAEDGIYTFTVANDSGAELTVGQSSIVGKGIYYSEVIGMLISFAVSPAGVCLIAILPCAAFVIFEIIGAIRRRAPQPEVETVKKQDEIPTYVPNTLQRRSKGDELDITVGDDKPAFAFERQKLVDAAGLFTQPSRRSEPAKEQKAPISEKDIDKLIKETKAKHELDAFREASSVTEAHKAPSRAEAAAKAPVTVSAPPADSNEEPNEDPTQEAKPEKRYSPSKTPLEYYEEEDIKRYIPEESVKRYEPKKPQSKLAPRVSRLDSLLQEDSNDTHYDIDDILKSLDSKENR